MWRKWHFHENFTCTIDTNLHQSIRDSPIIYFVTRFNLIQKYINGDHMLTIGIHIFQHLISSMFVLDVYWLIWRILWLVFIAPHCHVTVPLVQHCIITNGPLYRVSHLYAALLTSITLSPNLYGGSLWDATRYWQNDRFFCTWKILP